MANTVAEKCTFLADIRFATADEEQYVRELVAQVAEKSTVKGCMCRLEQVSYRPAMEYTERNKVLLDTMNEIWRENGLDEREWTKSPGGSDAAYITQAGVPCVDNIGVAGKDGHSVRERALLSSLADSAKRMAAVILCM